MPRTRNFSVGLTGGIGSGKSLVADMFAQHGAGIIDTDLIAHQLTSPGGAAIAAVAATFGDAYLAPNGAMDRVKMRELVFTDPDAKRRLEAILHPLIGIETERAAMAKQAPYLIFVVPLLVESGKWKQRVSRVLVVDCPELLQIERVMKRNGMTQEQVRAIMAAQATRAARLAAADDVVLNDSSPQDLQPQVKRLHDFYMSMAR